MSYGQRKCDNDELLSYFQVEAPIHRPSFFLFFFSLTIKDKTKISLTIKILHLGEGSFTRKVRIFFQEFNIRLYDKNSESDYFFIPPPKSEYFFQQHWESEYFF